MAIRASTRTHKALSRLAEICLDIAENVDIKGESGECVFAKEIGLGYRALSSYLREGVRAIAEIEEALHEARMETHLAKIGEDLANEVLIRIFGDKEVPSFNDDEIRQIKGLVAKLQEGWP